jgi:hypothetical protein
MEFVLIILWLFLCIAAGMFAEIRRDRNGVGWAVVAFFFSPLVAFILLAILKPKPPSEREAKPYRMRYPWPDPQDSATGNRP